MKIKKMLEQSGTGPLTVDTLMTLATVIHDAAPHEAQVIIRSGQDQRDHDEYWHVHVNWEEEIAE